MTRLKLATTPILGRPVSPEAIVIAYSAALSDPNIKAILTSPEHQKFQRRLALFSSAPAKPQTEAVNPSIIT